MRKGVFAALLAMTLFAWPAAAQEQRGTIEGVVKDSSGAVLPGVTVEARSGGSGVLSTTSNETGNFRFPSVLPGVYEVSAALAGFKPAKVADVEVKLGSIKSVELPPLSKAFLPLKEVLNGLSVMPPNTFVINAYFKPWRIS